MASAHEGAFLGSDADTQESVDLPYEARPYGLTIMGQTGYGKSTLFENLIRHDLDHRTSCILLDPHGDLSLDILAYAASSKLSDRVIILEVDPKKLDRVFGVNLYECPDVTNPALIDRTAAGVLAFFQKVWGQDIERQPYVYGGLLATTYTLVANPGSTMLDVPRLFEDAAFRARLLRAMPEKPGDPSPDYWRSYEGLTREADRQALSAPVINKVTRLLYSETFRLVVAQAKTTVPWMHVLDEGLCLLIRLPPGAIGQDTSNNLGTILLSQLTDSLYARSLQYDQSPNRSRPRLHLYFDEYARFASEQTSYLLKDLRKYNVGTSIAFQILADLKDQQNRGAALQLGSRIAFRLTEDDAPDIARLFVKPPPPVAKRRGGISQAPLEALLTSRPHPDPTIGAAASSLVCGVRRLISDTAGAGFGRPRLDQDVSVSFKDPRNGQERKVKHRSSAIHGGQLQAALSDLDRLLVSAMEAGISPEEHTKPFVEILANIAYGACDTSYFYDALTGESPNFREHSRLLRSLDSYVHGCLVDMRREIHPKNSVAARFPALESAMATYDPHWSWEPHPDSYAQLCFYSSCAFTLYFGLAHDPIVLPFDPQDERPRSEADMLAEATREMRDLPRGVAYCRIFQPSTGEAVIHKVDLVKPEEPAGERHYFDNQLERALRISRKIRGAEALDIQKCGGWSTEIGAYYKSEEFQEELGSFMRDWRSGSKSQPSASRKSKGERTMQEELSRIRARSRERYGTPREQVEEEIRQRRQQLLRPNAPQKPDAAKFNLAQETARAQRTEAKRPPRQQSTGPRDDGEPPTIGRRPPKKP